MPTVASNPAEFILTVPAGQQQSNVQEVTFDIPVGHWLTVIWVAQGASSGVVDVQQSSVVTGRDLDGSYNRSAVFTSGELVNSVNAAAGGPLSLSVQDVLGYVPDDTVVDEVRSYFLMLEGASPSRSARQGVTTNDFETTQSAIPASLASLASEGSGSGGSGSGSGGGGGSSSGGGGGGGSSSGGGGGSGSGSGSGSRHGSGSGTSGSVASLSATSLSGISISGTSGGGGSDGGGGSNSGGGGGGNSSGGGGGGGGNSSSSSGGGGGGGSSSGSGSGSRRSSGSSTSGSVSSGSLPSLSVGSISGYSISGTSGGGGGGGGGNSSSGGGGGGGNSSSGGGGGGNNSSSGSGSGSGGGSSGGGSGSRSSSLSSVASASSVGRVPPVDGPPSCDTVALPLSTDPTLSLADMGRRVAGTPGTGNAPLTTGALQVGPAWGTFPDYGGSQPMDFGMPPPTCDAGSGGGSCGNPTPQ